MVDAVTGGSLSNETPTQAHDLMEEMVTNNYQWHTARGRVRRQSGVHQVDATAALAAQLELLTKQISQMNKLAQVMSCEFCGGPHYGSNSNARGMFSSSSSSSSSNFFDHEQVDYVGHAPR